MSDERQSGGESTLSLLQKEQIDRLADQFEREFKAGEQPRIEAYLEQAPQLRLHVLSELMELEVKLRKTAGQQPRSEAYRQRFPQAGEVVDAVFGVARQPEPPCGSTREETSDADDTDADQEPVPERLGRYRIQRVLGRGGFGVVYLAHDPQLDRPVALKVPRHRRFQTREQVQGFIKEARTAAKLKHPALVAVYDVQEQDGRPCIVQEFIEGQDLAEWAGKRNPTYQQIAKLFIGIAEAVGHAHQQGLTHCDLKLTNVLMDAGGEPHVADFGLAVHGSVQRQHKGEIFGTPTAMAPEQVRGESHRLDGRTDIWAMGVMLYELLTGQKPFSGENHHDLFEDIRENDPRPPRQIDRTIPRELERICLRCLSKRRTDRYNTTEDLCEDLQAWLDDQPRTGSSASSPHSATESITSESSSDSSISATIIPKGLRSFDAEDADFFLDLLPGPRNRDGLPASVRFWKYRIEQFDPDKTFSVGLVYGPSGCGKSSLMKAGLLPRLSEVVLPIFVEATATDTESGLLRQLRKNLPLLPADMDLPSTCAELRMTGAGDGRKVLLVVDQLEQWLHAHTDFKGAQLVDALRQCEGSRLQAIVLVRDDFYLSVNRLFQELEIRLLEGLNQGVVDLFDPDHARKVLKAFGRAYGKLDDELTSEQDQFLTRAVEELAEENKIISVRLALFADMMKGRPWVPGSLEDVGGAGGVGVAFLEEAFEGKSAPPSHRVHQQAARGVLKALLPEADTDIRGSMQSTDQLRQAADYQNKPEQFEELLRILDAEVRLIAPSDPEDTDSASNAGSERRYYQLTHDYLVPSLRSWLTRKQKETRRGRAQLRLEERAAQWNAKPENRHLPAWWEYLNARLFTRSKDWTDAQRKMMRRAGKVQAIRWSMVLVVILVIGFGIQKIRFAERLKGAVDSMSLATRSAVPGAIQDLQEFPTRNVREALQRRYANAENDRRLSLSYGLAAYGKVQHAFLVGSISTAPATECDNIVTALKRDSDTAMQHLRHAAADAMASEDWELKTRLATVELYLGETSIAAAMLRGEPKPSKSEFDPIQRTVFIRSFPIWSGPVEKLVDEELVKGVKPADDASLRSGISLAIGSITEPSKEARTAWEGVLRDWYVNKADSGTHSAAEWALRSWGLSIKHDGIHTGERKGWDWCVTETGLTMIHIPAGQVKTPQDDEGERETIRVEQDFWLSDREITVGLFRQFVDDSEYAAKYPDAVPHHWEGEDSEKSPGPGHPVQRVNWDHAVMFCNWLSRKEVRKPSYQKEEKKIRDDDQTQKNDAWQFIPESDGYRLPTEDEWEYACRAGTTTDFACGNSENHLRDYAVFGVENTEVCGSKRCNSWGLFDMHGNVCEWCWDGGTEGSDPVGRGGAWNSTARYCQLSNRGRNRKSGYGYYAGFRVARGLLAEAGE